MPPFLTSLCSVNADLFSLFVKSFKLDDAIDFREYGVVFSQTDIIARMHFGSELANDDTACADGLAAEYLYAAPLRIAVSPVTRTPLSFLVCHGFYPLDGNFGDLHTGQRLPMSSLLVVALPSFHTKNRYFWAFLLGNDLTDYLCPFDYRGSQPDIFAVGNHQHIMENEAVSLESFHLFDGQHISGGNEMLLTTCFNDCVHCSNPYKKFLAHFTEYRCGLSIEFMGTSRSEKSGSLITPSGKSEK